MAPKHNSDDDNSDILKRSQRVLPLSEKVCRYRKNIAHVGYSAIRGFIHWGLGTYPLRTRVTTILINLKDLKAYKVCPLTTMELN